MPRFLIEMVIPDQATDELSVSGLAGYIGMNTTELGDVTDFDGNPGCMVHVVPDDFDQSILNFKEQ